MENNSKQGTAPDTATEAEEPDAEGVDSPDLVEVTAQLVDTHRDFILDWAIAIGFQRPDRVVRQFEDLPFDVTKHVMRNWPPLANPVLAKANLNYQAWSNERYSDIDREFCDYVTKSATSKYSTFGAWMGATATKEDWSPEFRLEIETLAFEYLLRDETIETFVELGEQKCKETMTQWSTRASRDVSKDQNPFFAGFLTKKSGFRDRGGGGRADGRGRAASPKPVPPPAPPVQHRSSSAKTTPDFPAPSKSGAYWLQRMHHEEVARRDDDRQRRTDRRERRAERKDAPRSRAYSGDRSRSREDNRRAALGGRRGSGDATSGTRGCPIVEIIKPVTAYWRINEVISQDTAGLASHVQQALDLGIPRRVLELVLANCSTSSPTRLRTNAQSVFKLWKRARKDVTGETRETKAAELTQLLFQSCRGVEGILIELQPIESSAAHQKIKESLRSAYCTLVEKTHMCHFLASKIVNCLTKKQLKKFMQLCLPVIRVAEEDAEKDHSQPPRLPDSAILIDIALDIVMDTSDPNFGLAEEDD